MDLTTIDLNVLRAILTLLLFITFVGLCVLMIFRGDKGYDAAADIPFKEFEQND